MIFRYSHAIESFQQNQLVSGKWHVPCLEHTWIMLYFHECITTVTQEYRVIAFMTKSSPLF